METNLRKIESIRQFLDLLLDPKNVLYYKNNNESYILDKTVAWEMKLSDVNRDIINNKFSFALRSEVKLDLPIEL